VVQTPEPSYIYFMEPSPRYDMVKSMDIYQWAYFQSGNVANQSVLTVVSLDNSTADHIRTNTYTLQSDPAALVYQNPNCKLIRYLDGTDYLSLNKELPNGTYVEIANLKLSLNGSTVSNMTKWQMS